MRWRSFVTGVRRGPEPDRVLATIMFTDIVGSTEIAARLGDSAWRELLERHHALVRRQLDRFRGQEIDTAGDGFVASFDGPARAIRCAKAIADSVTALDLEIKAAIHTGECEVADGKLAGIAVHIAARIAAQAQPGEVARLQHRPRSRRRLADRSSPTGASTRSRGSRASGVCSRSRRSATDVAFRPGAHLVSAFP